MTTPDLPLSDETLLQHAVWVRRLAGDLVQDASTADDLAQDTWLAFLRARPDAERSLGPWLRATLRHGAGHRARRRANRVAREAEVARSEAVPRSDELLEKAEEQQRLAQMVLELAEPYREALLLRFFEGLSPSAIAKAKGIPAATVRSHTRRGLQMLRERLDQENGGDRRAWVLALQPWALRSDLGATSAGAGWSGIGTSTWVVAASSVLLGAVLWAVLLQERLPEEPVDSPRSSRDHQVSLVEEGERTVDIPATRSRTQLDQISSRTVRLVAGDRAQPLAFFRIEVDGQTLTTDANGAVALPVGAMELTAIDIPGLAIETQTGHLESSLELVTPQVVILTEERDVQVSAGPSFRVEWNNQVPSAADTIEVTLVNDNAGERWGTRQVAPLRQSESGYDGAWVRFSEMPATSVDGARPGSWHLEIRAASGLFAGRGEIERIELGSSPTVHVEFTPRGIVEGVVRAETPGILRDALVHLTLGEGGSHNVTRSVLDGNGRFKMSWLRPGTYRLSVRATGASLVIPKVIVHPGETQWRDLDVLFDTTVGPIQGVVSSRAGSTARQQLLVFLLDSDGGTVGVEAITWARAEPDGVLVAAFGFERVPAGELSLEIISLDDMVTHTSTPRTFQAPRTDIEAELIDDVLRVDWRVDVRDESTGEPIDEFEIEIRLKGARPRRFQRTSTGDGTTQWSSIAGNLRWNTFTGPAPFRALRADAIFDWSVRAKGYRSAAGDEAQFDAAPGGGRSLQVRLLQAQ